MAKVQVELEEHEDNVLPFVFNWSVAWPSVPVDGVVAIARASTSPRLGTEAHQRVRPPATIVEIPLDEEGLRSAHEALAEAYRMHLDNKRGDAH